MTDLAFHTMQASFLRDLALFGFVSLAFLLIGVHYYINHNHKLLQILLWLGFTTAAFYFVLKFIKVTAPTRQLATALDQASHIVFCISVGLLLTALFYRFLNQKKLRSSFHYRHVLSDIEDFIVLLDSAGRIIGQNRPESELGSLISSGFLAQREETFQLGNRAFYHTFTQMGEGSQKACVSVHILHDITEQHDLIEELRRRNTEADLLHESLHSEIEIEDELLLQEEYQRIYASIHEELQSKTRTLSTHLHVLLSEPCPSQSEQINNLHCIARELRETLADIRKIVYR